MDETTFAQVFNHDHRDLELQGCLKSLINNSCAFPRLGMILPPKTSLEKQFLKMIHTLAYLESNI